MKKIIYSILIAVTLGTAFFSGLTNITYAKAVNKNNTTKETRKQLDSAIDKLAQAFEDAYDANRGMDEVELSKGMLSYATGELELPTEKELQLQALYGSSFFSAEKFGKCLLNQYGIIGVKNTAKALYSRQIEKLLRSHAWKKASEAIIKRVAKRLGKKVAKKLAEKIASSLVPGIGWASLGWVVGKCGIKAR